MKNLVVCLLVAISSLSFTPKINVDLLVYNAVVYTIDSSFSIAEAFAVKDGKILALGKSEALLKKYDAKEVIDAGGKAVYPGLIDAHAHFFEYGMSLQTADLVGTNSWEEILMRLREFAKGLPKDQWLIGHGWDQNDWTSKNFPSNEKLNELFPDRPVFLSRVDGHAAIANQKALDIAGIKPFDKISGGEIEITSVLPADSSNVKLTGILIDNATRLVESKMPQGTIAQAKEALLDAQRNCFEVGLTTIDDCGLDYRSILFIDSLQKSGDLKMRIYAMLSDSKPNYDFIFKQGKIKTAHLNVRAFKVYADGALGSRGACLLQPYADKPGWSGFLLSSQKHFDSVARILMAKGFQMCTHAIGDSGNRTMLHIYARYLKGKNDLRWRIEHAQVINENDFQLFGQYNIIPSVQPTHATSDMYWAGERLGKERIKGAYAYKKLMQENDWIPLGTDFPVEDISPFKTFYAAVTRKDAKDWPAGGFQSENALTRQQTIRGMTIWAAKANFEENEKGSLEAGKLADFIILDNDLMKTNEKNILNIKVLQTFVNGERVYQKK